MTRARQPKPTAPPLAATLRQALAQGWHTLDALSLLAGRATGARLRVHAALGELRAAGCALEERVERGVAEVRLGTATLPAPVPDDGLDGLDADDREAARVAIAEEDAESENDPRACPECEEIHPADDRHDGPFTPNLRRPSPPVEGEPADAASYYLGRERNVEDEPALTWSPRDVLARATSPLDALKDRAAALGRPLTTTEGFALLATALDAPTPPVDQAAPVEPPRERTAAEWIASHNHEAASAPKGPGPSSRCAVCGGYYSRHADCSASPAGHPFTPKPRGRPRATPSTQPPIPNAAPAMLPRAKQRRTPGPVVDVDGGRVERFRSRATPETRAMLDAVCDEADERVAAVQAPDPAAGEMATPSEQAAILDGMREQWDAAVAEHRAGRAAAEPAPCVDCGEEPGSCPEGRCRDCDLEHLMTAGSCRECLTWIMREDMAGPREKQHSIGCSLAAEPCYPRNAAEYIATRKARYGWTPPQGWTFTGWAAGAAAELEASRGGKAKRGPVAASPPCRPPLCYRDDIHEPARVRSFARPLCERHRAWVEGAGGSVRYEPKEETV